jgi:hypothetical protein
VIRGDGNSSDDVILVGRNEQPIWFGACIWAGGGVRGV